MSTSQTKTIMALVDQFITLNIAEGAETAMAGSGESVIARWASEKSNFETFLTPLLSKNKAPKTDPAKPKRATTTYQLYMANHRQEVVDDGFAQKEVMSELARRYNAEKDQESDEYMELVAEAQTDKDRYTEEMKSYVPTPGFEPKRKDPNAPKRAKSAYNIFCEENRADVKENNPEMTQPEIMSELGRLWKEMDPEDDESERLKELAAEDKERYIKAMESYVRPPEDELPAPRKRGGSGGKSKKTGPVKATSAYMYFRKERAGELSESGMSSKDIADEVIAAWNELKEDEEQLAVYTEMAAEDKARYEKEKAVWDATKSAQSQSDEDNSGDDRPVKATRPTKGTPPMKRPTKGTTPKKQLGVKKSKTIDNVVVTKATKSNSGYIAFCKANRTKMKQDKPELVGKELTVQLQRAWKKLSAETRAQWA